MHFCVFCPLHFAKIPDHILLFPITQHSWTLQYVQKVQIENVEIKLEEMSSEIVA